MNSETLHHNHINSNHQFQHTTTLTLHEKSNHIQNDDKQQEVFFKSQVSLAETCQDEPTKNQSFEADVFDQDCLSMDSQDLSQGYLGVEICQDFLIHGRCMKGQKCNWAHSSQLCERQKNKRQKRTRLWIWEELPEIIIERAERANSFLN